MTEQTCPECGEALPQELGQHALTPTSGLVQCPSCGATATIDRPEGTEADEPDVTGEGPDYFAGEDTIEGVMDELERKEES